MSMSDGLRSPVGSLRETCARILVVEDHAALRRGMAIALRDAWGHADEEGTGDAAVRRLADPDREPYDVVVTDLRLPGADGLAVLEAARARDERTRVLLLTAFGSVDTAVRGDARGRVRFPREAARSRPARPARRARARTPEAARGGERAARGARRAARRGLDRRGEPRDAAAVELARRVAPKRSNVLLTGETGTGKELFAGLIHEASSRGSGPLVKVNCAALPETLLESELFGHERGAFTGADRRRIGRFEEASGGTLFLDEVGEMSPAIQAKLLRVLQDQEFHRVGGTQTLRTDARLVAATNRGSRARSAARRIPRRSLLPARRDPDPPAAAARATRGRGRARPPLPERVRGRAGRSARIRARCDGAPARAPLARERSGAAQCDRARAAARARAADPRRAT